MPSIAIPIGSELSKSASAGVDYTLFLEKPIGNKNAVRVTFEYTSLTFKKYTDLNGTVINGRAETRHADCSYIRRLHSQDKGVYFLVGSGLAFATLEEDEDDRYYRNTSNGISVAAGIGYNFNRWFGLELKYTHLAFVTKDSFPPDSGILKVGLAARF